MYTRNMNKPTFVGVCVCCIEERYKTVNYEYWYVLISTYTRLLNFIQHSILWLAVDMLKELW